MKVNKKLDKVLGSSKWVKLIERFYTNLKGYPASWIFAQRTGNSESVIIVARTKETGSFIVTKEFRVPFNNFVYAFPAGLIDIDETVEEAAIRELKEETGYKITRINVASYSVSISAGLTDEMTYIVYAECEEEHGPTALEDSEEIEVLKLPPSDIPKFLEAGEDLIFDIKMYAILNGELK